MMPSDFPGRPWLLKGALVVFGAPVALPTNIIIFQYNPETMTRTLKQPGADDSGGAGGVCLNAGDTANVLQSPVESYSLTVELDATDQIEQVDTVTLGLGLHPALAALELLLYPGSTVALLNSAMAKFGSWRIVTPKMPFVLFVWGAPRIVPVFITSISITETAFDQLLNPIQATVDLQMRSLTDSELKLAPAPFSTLSIINQVAKEVISRAQIGGIAAQAEALAVRGLLSF
jgi:hypothetical protein